MPHQVCQRLDLAARVRRIFRKGLELDIQIDPQWSFGFVFGQRTDPSLASLETGLLAMLRMYGEFPIAWI